MKKLLPAITIIILGFASLFVNCTSIVTGGDPASWSESFNSNWNFFIDAARFNDPAEIEDNSHSVVWEQVSLPHTPRIEPLIVNDQWQGDCWYMKKFTYDQAWDGKLLFLRFEAAMNVADIWINGKKKIEHAGGYLPFTIHISGDLFENKENVLWVRLNNEDNPITGPKPLPRLDFNMYGGLYRDVILSVKDPVHITDEQYTDMKAGGGIFVTFPEVNNDRSIVAVSTHVKNSGNENSTVLVKNTLEYNGIFIAEKSRKINLQPGEDQLANMDIIVHQPRLWSPGTPFLYQLTTEVIQQKITVDIQVTNIGIREFEFRDNKLYINGEQHFLRGVNRHQEYPYIGYALSNNANYRDAVKIKEAGFDYVRLSHYPHAPAFLDACDELGIVTINPILGWQFFNKDSKFSEHVLKSARGLIRRDRNHACVLAWEVSLNETRMPVDLIDALIGVAREEYPTDRYYTAGWQEHGYDIYLQARQHRLGHGEEYPDKPYVVSEYGDWEYYAMNAGLNQDEWKDLLKEERSSRQLLGESDERLLQQARNIQEAHNDNFTTPAFADGYWVMYDYNRGYHHDLEASGIMSIFRLPKFSYHFYRSQRGSDEQVKHQPAGPMIFIASRLQDDQQADIRIFSNCDEVELLANGKNLGSQGPDNDRYSGHLPHPPFTFKNPGIQIDEITAIGRIDGKEVAREVTRKAEKPDHIRLSADISGKPWEAGCNDVIFIYATAVDKQDQPVINYQGKIRFMVTGEAEIIGDDTPAFEGGSAAILVRAKDKPGKVTITVESDELESESISIRTVTTQEVV